MRREILIYILRREIVKIKIGISTFTTAMLPNNKRDNKLKSDHDTL